jgi:hypothetical protein
MTWHPNRTNYKFMIVNKKTGERKMYLNAKDLCDEYNINQSTLYRILSGKPSRKYDKDFLFIRCRILV